MFGAVCTVALALAVALPPDEGSRPKLIIKEKDYFLHALPPPDKSPDLQRRWAPLHGVRSLPTGPILLYTATATAEMKVLAAGTTSLLYVERNSGRPDCSQTCIAGVAGDRERLFVLLWSGSITDYPGGPTEGTYYLLVVRPADGVLARSLELKGNGVPTKRPEETVGRGPLRLQGDGVACFGTRFEFKGTELIKRSAEKKP
jgi:hypothetical protein